MQKVILITGSTDGIGLETARTLVNRGNPVLLHGRNKFKLEQAAGELSATSADAVIKLTWLIFLTFPRLQRLQRRSAINTIRWMY